MNDNDDSNETKMIQISFVANQFVNSSVWSVKLVSLLMKFLQTGKKQCCFHLKERWWANCQKILKVSFFSIYKKVSVLLPYNVIFNLISENDLISRKQSGSRSGDFELISSSLEILKY